MKGAAVVVLLAALLSVAFADEAGTAAVSQTSGACAALTTCSGCTASGCEYYWLLRTSCPWEWLLLLRVGIVNCCRNCLLASRPSTALPRQYHACCGICAKSDTI